MSSLSTLLVISTFTVSACAQYSYGGPYNYSSRWWRRGGIVAGVIIAVIIGLFLCYLLYTACHRRSRSGQQVLLAPPRYLHRNSPPPSFAAPIEPPPAYQSSIRKDAPAYTAGPGMPQPYGAIHPGGFAPPPGYPPR
ncbi:hypothetical protein BC835DRAFT_1304857 [Cytidiella melzeri]|nr:hypothetical protein BC835DRAFT_1304857 [Cytidiella melzeri]